MTINLDKPFFDVPFDTYWYDHQFVKFLVQFMAIFEGMQVKTGRNSLGSATDKIYIPIRRGNADRVVNSLIAQGTTNLPMRLPIFAAEIVQIEKAPDRVKGREHVQRDTILPVGGAFPDDIKVVYKKTPTPYIVHFELSLMTSNDDQKFQVLEQILTLFDPDIQIQTSDNVHEWNKISNVILDGLNLETSYPYNQDQKIIITSFDFSSVVYLQTPIDFKSNFIKSIKLKLAQLDSTSDMYESYISDTDSGYEEVANLDELSEINNLKS